jgi:hypothetical protein
MYPTSPQYRHSIVNKTYPPDNGGHVFTPILENEEPKYESGNKAIVFKVTDDKTEKTKALKLFLIDNKERFSQYLEISNFLNKFNTQFFVSFNFIEKFIYVEVNQNQEENYFPGLIMEWAEGKTLGYKVQELCSTKDKKNLKKIAESFKDLSFFLLDNNIGHGDLKHDNIIVDQDNNMKLIDYDGIYVPAFNNQISKELGTDSFQHPLRKSTDFNADIDHFSILTIYCSLIALSINPDLFLKFNDQQNLLFTKEDFLNPDDSELFKALFQIKEVKRLVFCIKQSLLSNSIYIDNIKDILNNVFPKPSIVISHLPEIPLAGNDITISWTTENTDSVKIKGKDYAISGKITEKYNASKKITFEIANPFDKSTVSYEIKVLENPIIKIFKLRQQKIEFQKCTFLDWDVNYVSKIFLYSNGSKEDVSDKRSLEITPLKDTTYELSIIGLDGKTTISQKVNVQVFKRVLITEFKSNLDFVVESIPIKLTWKTENASKILLSSPLEVDIDVTGKNSIELKPKKDASYTLIAKNELFQASEQIGIGVQTLHKIPALDLGMPKMPTINVTIPDISNDIFNENEKVFNDFLNKKEKFSLTKSLKSLLLE